MIPDLNSLAEKILAVIFISFLSCASTRSNIRFETISRDMQSAMATLSGTVVDEKDAVITDADVAVTNADTGLQRHGITNSHGYFVIPLLPPGHYNVSVKHQGFASLEVNEVTLNVNDQRALKLQLKVGPISESVIVKGTSLIQTESAAVSTVVDRQFVENLPLNGRSFSTLIELTPGVVLTKEEGQFSVNGQRTNANYFTVDGVSANVGIDPVIQIQQTAGGSIPAFSALGTTSNLISIDALQEFTIQSSTYAPEFGRLPGAQVATVSRAGTNHFHGTAFEYFRNDALDANDWFSNSRGLENPALRQNDFGGVLGGPIVRDRSFFFFSYEGLRLREPHVGLTAVPGLSERTAAPTKMQPFLKALPMPNGPNLGDGLAEFDASYSNPSSLSATSIRLDQVFSSKITMFGRFNYAPSEGNQRGGTPQSQTVSLSSGTSFLFKTVTTTIASTQTLSPRVTNDIRANYSRNSAANTWFIDSFGGGVPPSEFVLFPPFASSTDSIFDFILIEDIGFEVGKNARNLQRQINLVDNLAIATGAHQLKVGIDWRRLSPILDSSEYFQSALFFDVAAALAGIADFVSIEGKTGKSTTNVTNFSGYAQDDWTIGKRLTLNYGVRWEYNPAASITATNPPIIAVGRLEDPSTIHLAPPGTAWNTNHTSFAPRFGVAFRISEKPGRERVLRGGFGVFFDTAGRLAGSVLGGTTASTNFLSSVPFPLTPTQATPLPPLPPTPPYSFVPVFELGLKQPRTYEWNVAMEQSLGTNQTITATYVGAAGRKLLRLERLINPTPEFASVNGVTNLATSDYHALQLQYKRRLSRGLQALASYTWSHSIDINSNDTFLNFPGSKLNPEIDRASSNFDVRHSLAAGVTYDLAGPSENNFAGKILRHWSIDALFRTHTALPVNITTAKLLFGVRGVQRPDLVSGVPLYLKDTNVAGGRRINRAAFSIPPTTRQGTLGRNALRGFPATQLDFALHRQFSLSERWTVQLRAEFFNIFNHPNFADPESNLNEGALFGQSIMMLGRSLGGLNPLYQIGGPRSTQLALRLQF
jgi:Carboxypeptidase regulatory-like domain/TonB dependent receptor